MEESPERLLPIKKIIMKKVKIVIFILLGIILCFLPIVGLIVIKSPQLINIKGYAEKYSTIIKNEDLDLLKSRLPLSATKITYSIRPYAQCIEASFQLPEEKFLNWGKQHNWDITKIPIPININSIIMKNKKVEEFNIELQKGFYFKQITQSTTNPNKNESVRVIYFNSDTNICYYRFTQ